ncbi:DUF885 domain-containing protein [Corynebacterium aquatimens]|uniref:Uncharacterized protein (DUF885 family) n=1 Tax=Corynebacterium aquatimens TaxID=1190508 RepID=A0A931DW60_9CORY|nr:DUF885 domain-containing protein [Corynebacterium aquatimens]MBG6122619.1 uncharacterized protein (DUF885 family) [Corynebacterium aquatimens]WJY64841.1 hypothetical protein CAQUA_00465 [Corynebacterium aquatimens]
MTAKRTPSLLDATCEAFVYDLAEISPTLGTELGLEGYDGELQDFSPNYWSAIADRIRELIADVDALNDGTDASDDEDDFDSIDELTAEILRERMSVELELHHQGENLRQLNNITSPVQEIRKALTVMPKDTADDLENVESRLRQVSASLAGYRESLAEAASQGDVASARQIDCVTSQCEALADDGSLLEDLGLAPDNDAVRTAKGAFADMGDWLSTELAPLAKHYDAVGRDRYELFSEYFLGRQIDLDEAYDWSLEELKKLVERQGAVAKKLYGDDVNVRGAYRRLDNDPGYSLTDSEVFVSWMQDMSDRLIDQLDGTLFTLPEELRTIECALGEAGHGGVVYAPPSEDLSRPGTLWWSTPGGETIHAWHELTKICHEGVPGHHVQQGIAMAQRNTLNLWRRTMNFNSAHGEGWSVYAENLMEEVGFFEDPAYEMGLLDSVRLRLARVAVDIGVHLRKQTPDGTGTWDVAYAKAFLRDNTAMNEARLGFELDRYLGWPGQATSYALGYRDWLDLRDAALAQGMSLKEFHDKALRLGSMPMDILRRHVLN